MKGCFARGNGLSGFINKTRCRYSVLVPSSPHTRTSFQKKISCKVRLLLGTIRHLSGDNKFTPNITVNTLVATASKNKRN